MDTATATDRASKTSPRRQASRSTCPKGVTATIERPHVEVKGPKGQLSRPSITETVAVKAEGAQAARHLDAPGRDASRLQGLMRAHRRRAWSRASPTATRRSSSSRAPATASSSRARRSTSRSATRTRSSTRCRRASRRRSPADSKGTVLVLNGADKELIGQTAAKIRGFRPPEPYGGKGVRYRGERVREKAGKAGKGGKK